VAINDTKLELMRERTDKENINEELKTRIVKFKNEIRSFKEINLDLKNKASNLEKEYLDKLRLSREEDWSKISQIESEKSELEKSIMNTKTKLTEVESSKELLYKEYSTEVDRLKKENQDNRFKMENLETENRTLQTDKEHQSIAFEKSRIRADEAIMNYSESNSKLDNLKRQIQDLNEKITHLETQNKSYQDQIEHANEQLSREIEAYEHTIERQILKNTQEKQAIIQEMELMARERLQFIERIDRTEDVLEKVSYH
jgi:chromosome segregation ATPase